jgi:hypothetical protein
VRCRGLRVRSRRNAGEASRVSRQRHNHGTGRRGRARGLLVLGRGGCWGGVGGEDAAEVGREGAGRMSWRLRMRRERSSRSRWRSAASARSQRRCFWPEDRRPGAGFGSLRPERAGQRPAAAGDDESRTCVGRLSPRILFFFIAGHVSPYGSTDAPRTPSLGCIV